MKNKLDVHVSAYKGENIYDFDNKILLTWYPQRIVMSSKGARSVLELGLGHGLTTNIFSNNFDKHVVLEGSPAVTQNFKKKFPKCGAQIIETYFEEFHTEEKFDVIVMGFILEHVDDPCEIISRYKKFLAPGGKIFLAVPNAEVLNRRLGHLAGMLGDIETLSENDLLLGHKRYYTVNSLSLEVVRAGYQIDKMEGIYLKPFTTSQIISLNLDEKVIRALCEVGVDYPELSCGILAQISAR
ncbi:MAG: class I SAM-dependent methyltransferase [Nitrospiraceae bacterium]|nr:MAG: class I SAM-dependent methyltransferase [Nitrospiraceae bacterium]